MKKCLLFLIMSILCFPTLYAQGDMPEIEADAAQTKPIRLNEQEVLAFFNQFQTFLKKNDKQSVMNSVHFPLESDCVYSNQSEEKESERGITQKFFSDNWEEILNEHTEFLFKRADFKKLLNKEGYTFYKKETNVSSYSLQLSEYEQNWELTVHYENEEDYILEHAIVYAFKLFNDKIKLYSIHCLQ